MSDKTNQLQNFINGKKASTGGLHFVGTPDTKRLVEDIKKQVQKLLALAHDNTHYPSVKEKITSETINSYKQFACGESISTLEDSLRGKHVYFFSDPSGDYQEKTELKSKKGSSLNDKLMHDLFTLSAIKTHGAKTTNLVQACIPYARQDDMTPKKRQPASLEFIGNIISSITGNDGYALTIDVHNNSATRGNFSKTNFINLYTGWFIEECIKDIGEEKIVLSGADQGGDKKIKAIAKEQGLKKIIVVKDRDYSKENSVDETDVYGDIKGKDVLIHDDMLDTGGTMCTLLREMLKKRPRSINIAVTHGMFNGEAIKKLEEVIKESNGVIQNIYITNSINKEGLPDFVKQIDISNILANNILRIYKGLGLERNDNRDYTKKQ